MSDIRVMPPKLAAAFLAAQREMPVIGKDAENPHFRSSYASLDAIITAALPVLHRHDLAVLQTVLAPDRDEAGKVTAFTVETLLIHESGESYPSRVIVPLTKSDAQGAGSALTYGRRYGLAALLCLATEEDDDGNAASRPARKPAPADGPRYADTRPSIAVQSPLTAGSGLNRESELPFGKHKGTKVKDVPRDYLDWLAAQTPRDERGHQWQALAQDEIERRDLNMDEQRT